MNRRVADLCAGMLLLATAATAQRHWTYENAEHGFTMELPRWLEAVPAKPGDTQTLAQFKGSHRTRHRLFRPEAEMTLLVVRIRTSEGPTTGAAEEEDDGETPPRPELTSFTDQRVEHLNSASTLKDYLRIRRLRHNLWDNDKLLRSVPKDGSDREYVMQDVASARGAKYGADVRAFVREDASEIFALVALGPGCNVFFDDVVDALKSLEFTRVEGDGDAEDPYADSDLRDLERRREVRAELVPGWQAYDTENFILVTNVDQQRLIDVVLTDLEVMRAAYLERFPPAEGADMSAVSTVRLCEGYTDYLRYAGKDKDGTGGYWNFTEEELVLFNPERRVPKSRPWLAKVDPTAVLYHEAMHQYFHYSNRAAPPASWFNEGYGEFFGGAEIDRRREELGGIRKNRFRLELIRLARKKDRTPPSLQSMLRMTQPEFYSNYPMENYAYSWAFCFFLEDQRAKSDRSRSRVDAWAELPDRYLAALRAATDEKRAELPPNAPEDWISMFQYDIQEAAIEETLEDIDMEQLQAAFELFVRRL